MQSLKDIFYKLSGPFINNNTVHCARETETVEMDNPAFAQLDPHLKYDDDSEQQQDIEMEMPIPGQQFSRRPPSFDALLNNIKSITKKVEHIKGFKFEISMPLSSNFHIQQSWNIPDSAVEEPTTKKGGGGLPSAVTGKGVYRHYQLGVQYAAGSMQQLMQQKPTAILTGRWDSQGKLEGVAMKRVHDKVNLRLASQFPTGADLMFAQMHLDCDIEGDDYLHTIKYGTGLFSVNMMQTIGKNLVMGFEWMNLLERKLSLFNYAFRYTQDKQRFYGQYVKVADMLCFAYSLNLLKKAHVISELNINTGSGETSSVLGFKQRFGQSEVTATVNSKGKISTVINIFGFSYELKLCADVNYKKDFYKFGYGLTLGQSQM